jgi:hypothetical protein
MRQPIILLFTLALLILGAGIARAQDYGINTIVGYVDMAERRLNEGDANSARSNLENARQMLPGASAEAKADKQYKDLPARIAKLDKLIAAKEQAAATVDQADELFRQADKDRTWGKIEAEQDNYDQSITYYKACLSGLDKAAATDPAVKQRQSPSSMSFADTQKECQDGVTAMGKQASGEGKVASNTEEGKTALEGYALATKTFAAKKPTTLETSAAIKAAKDCAHNLSTLRSLILRNGKHAWEGTEKIGDLTIETMRDKCDKLEKQLEAKPSYGCGKHYLGVSQDRASIYDHWNAVEGSGKMSYQAEDCADMPKKSQLPGLSASYKSKYVAACGADAVFIIIHNRWLENPTQRQMSGECWKKGALNINL